MDEAVFRVEFLNWVIIFVLSQVAYILSVWLFKANEVGFHKEMRRKEYELRCKDHDLNNSVANRSQLDLDFVRHVVDAEITMRLKEKNND